ncbi:MAG TPA: squalene synthase HpnD [Verrucomicrobiales bacterium]|nr:squalene synthase HpnD [Verrucomicrobiales bacterium]|tara:strand:- start:2033 stop:2851 length:819 start_codon:yes stop_codon:yes gene_type:complete
MTKPAEITRRAKSNLAFAFMCVPQDRRPDLNVFYAFCRVVDDIADDTSLPPDQKRKSLQNWMQAIERDDHPEHSLEAQVVDMRKRHSIDPSLLQEIIRGCESDLSPQRFGTWEDLQQYSYRVASTVGLILLPLFGASEAARDYSISLGHCLQLTNIIRDVGEDLENGLRIYLPLADLHRFQYTERDLVGRVYDGRFLSLMNFQAERAERIFEETANLLPAGDRKALRAAEVMRKIYHSLLQQMRRDQFRVFDRRYRISTLRKFGIMVRQCLG